MYFSNIIQNQVSSAMQIPMRFVWWILPVTMWLLLFRKCWDFCIYLFPEVTEMNMRNWIREGDGMIMIIMFVVTLLLGVRLHMYWGW